MAGIANKRRIYQRDANAACNSGVVLFANDEFTRGAADGGSVTGDGFAQEMHKAAPTTLSTDASPAMRIRLLVLPAALSLVLSACAPVSGQETAAVDPTVSAIAVQLATAEQQTIDRIVVASGPVAAWEEMQLGVELSGVRVTALHVDVGQHVRKGEVLLELDRRSLDSDLGRADAAVTEALAGAALAKANLTRGDKMAQKQLISASALDELRAALTQADAKVATAQAQRHSARLQRDFASLRAPDDGVISRRLVQPGQVVSGGSELLRLIRRGRVEWRAELAEADLLRVSPGATVQLVQTDGHIVEGTVRAVSPEIDTTTRTGTVFADLPAPAGLRPGMYLEGRIVIGATPALLLPSAAIVRRDGHAYVFTVGAGGVVARQRVVVGAAAGDRVEVLQGLDPGTAAVVRGAGFLSDGDRVRVVSERS